MPSRVNGPKRQDLVVEALARTRQPVRVVFIGAADDPAWADGVMARAEAVAPGRASWLGAVSDERKIELLGRALGVLVPPLDEDYGYVTLEAMLSARAVITCTDSGGPLEFVEHGRTGLVCEPDAAALADAMDELWADRARARALGQAGLAAYRALGLSWEHVVQCLLGLNLFSPLPPCGARSATTPLVVARGAARAGGRDAVDAAGGAARAGPGSAGGALRPGGDGLVAAEPGRRQHLQYRQQRDVPPRHLRRGPPGARAGGAARHAAAAFLRALLREPGVDRAFYLDSMRRSHGPAGLADAQRWLAGEASAGHAGGALSDDGWRRWTSPGRRGAQPGGAGGAGRADAHARVPPAACLRRRAPCRSAARLAARCGWWCSASSAPTAGSGRSWT